MKKHLLSTSAIALGVAMASPVAAQQWDLTWGGFANTHIGISDIDNDVFPGRDEDGVNVYTNSELIFSPSVTLDNGMTFGFSVQMEALNGGGGADGIDESYVTISSDMLGRIVLGAENSAGYLSIPAAPQVGTMPINSPSINVFVPVTGATAGLQAGRSSFTEVAGPNGGSNDVQRITYYTPSFNGLTVGVSYAPSSAGNASNNAPVDFDAAGNTTDIFDIGVSYSQSFNGVDINLGARYGTGDYNGAGIFVPVGQSVDPETWGVGGTVGASGFIFGVAYAENDLDLAGGNLDQEGLSIGASYDIPGPWTVGLEGYFGETKTVGGDDEYEVIKLTGARSLGSGVSWEVYYANVQTKNASNAAGFRDIDGDVIATAINLSF